MKKKVAILLSSVMICTLVACGNVDTSSDKGQNQAQESIIDYGEQSEEVTVVSADYPEYESAEGLVNAADIVFSGMVIDTQSEYIDIKMEDGKDSSTGLDEASPVPYTIYSIKVERIYKGDTQEEIIKIKCPGGNIDGSIFVSEINDQIEEGQNYMFLVKTFENSYPSLLNDTQSVYNLNKSDDEWLNELLNILKWSDAYNKSLLDKSNILYKIGGYNLWELELK